VGNWCCSGRTRQRLKVTYEKAAKKEFVKLNSLGGISG